MSQVKDMSKTTVPIPMAIPSSTLPAQRWSQPTRATSMRTAQRLVGYRRFCELEANSTRALVYGFCHIGEREPSSSVY